MLRNLCITSQNLTLAICVFEIFNFFGDGQKMALAIYMRGRKKSQKNEKKD